MLIDAPIMSACKDSGNDMKKTRNDTAIEWKEWSKDSFNEAKREGRLVLLDLTASWCHWCHVMDEKTYSDPDVAEYVNKNFVPIRVDIDKRPDISERYNRGGFPTTAFLSDQGESIWGATFIPPSDMKRIIRSILNAKESGEIDEALERNKMESFDVSRRPRTGPAVGSDVLQFIFEDIFSAYDTVCGGFGSEPKFPHPDVLDLLMMKYIETNDTELADAVLNSIGQMASGLHDKIEGGVFRYSVTRDWRTPHYEKMLETNVGFLRNLIHAYGIFGEHGLRALSLDITKYLMANLNDPRSGGFYGSQDADEEYYKLTADERGKRRSPSVDRTVYAGWNAEASAAFTLAGIILDDEELLDAGRASWEYGLKHQWNPKLGLMRHVASEEIYLFEDQVSFLAALLAQLALSSDESRIKLAEKLIDGVDRAFGSTDGRLNDVMKVGNAIGELDTPRKPLVENSNWALALAKFGSVTHQRALIDRAREILDSYARSEIESHGVFAAAYLRARWAIDHGFSIIEIHAKDDARKAKNLFLATVLTRCHPSMIPMTVIEKGVPTPYAVVCTDRGCSRKIDSPEDLLMFLGNIR